MILTIKTDNPMAEIGLYAEDGGQITYEQWHGHKQLSQTILIKIETLLDSNEADFKDILGVVFYEGPGSFTGLRIGASVANALEVPVSNQSGANWQINGVKRLVSGENKLATPLYGSEPHITKQKK